MKKKICFSLISIFSFFCLVFVNCSKGSAESENDIADTVPQAPSFDISSIKDYYSDIASPSFCSKWSVYNVHDPSIIKIDDTFYCYSTDVAYGYTVEPGIQIRKSKDMVEWKYVGHAFNGLPAKGKAYIKSKGATPYNALWAPCIINVNGELRLYYSLSSPQKKTSVIGLYTSSNPESGWEEKGLVIKSSDNWTVTQTNAIDPTVIIDKNGQYWMYYGSAYDGIYILELNPETGLALKSGDIGTRIAQRGFTGGTINGNIEGPEIIYNKVFDKYYLFLAYDWLQTKYNIRVGRADNPEGPFYDFDGIDMNEENDNIPMIIAPYKFNNHAGWQGVAHCSVFSNNNKFFIAHQGRPFTDSNYMIMHLRELFWTDDGWPVASPERYAGIKQHSIPKSKITGTWQHIKFNYNIVPGYSAEQISPDLQAAENLVLSENGTINGSSSEKWTFSDSWLQLSRADGTIEKLYVHYGRDWEMKIDTCLLFTGYDQNGKSYWGKK
jgi:arabinan endo-1,5-alpha-L-arabinosidase